MSDDRVPCLGGCGAPVGPGQKCVACATQAVHDMLTRRVEQKQAERDRINARPLPKPKKPPAPGETAAKHREKGRARRYK